MRHADLKSAQLTKASLDHAAAHIAEAHRAACADKGLVQDIEAIRRKLVSARARAQEIVKALEPAEARLL